MSDFLLSMVLIATGLYGLAVMYLFFAALIARSRRERHRRAVEAIRPEIERALVEYVAGGQNLQPLRRYYELNRGAFEESLLHYHARMSGDSRDRLSSAAIEIGLVRIWMAEARSKAVARRRGALSRLALLAAHEPSRRLSGDVLLAALEDADAETRLEAARSLVHSGDMAVIGQVFRVAVAQPLIVRAVLAEDLRRYAMPLCDAVVPECLRSSDNRRVLATLELVSAWERALPLTGLENLVRSRVPGIRLLALKILPLAPATRDGAEAVVRALDDPDEEVASTAAASAARMKLEHAVVPLARCMRQGKVRLSRSAAAALAALPPRGWETLEEMTHHQNPIAVSAAVEALSRARKGAAED